MQTRNVAVCDKLGRRLKTYPITIPSREDGPRDADFAREALERAKVDSALRRIGQPHGQGSAKDDASALGAGPTLQREPWRRGSPLR
jgi:hypothetical protein